MSEYFDPTSVKDSDKPFEIDPVTREIKNKNNKKIVLIRGDHNSERFTFEIPRFVEGRDVAKCNSVQIHYINIGNNRQTSTGVYTVNDLNAYQFVHDILTCSWLISSNATKHEGTLNFLIRFAEIENETEIKYAWHTETYKGIVIAENINADAAFETEYVDIIEQWKGNVMNELYDYINYTVENNIDVAQIGKNQEDIVELQNEQAVQKARMDTFTTLPSGSTSANAELVDMRVSVDGKTYTNAGTATREQFKIERLRSAYGSVYTNGTPVVDYLKEDHVSLYIPKTTHVFYNGRRYDIADVEATYVMAGTQYPSVILFNVLFNPDTKEFSIRPAGNTFSNPLIRVGCIYMDRLFLNDWASSEGSNFLPQDVKPSHVMTYTNRSPYFTITAGVMILTIPSDLYFYYDCNAHIIQPREITYALSSDKVVLNILYNKSTDELTLRSHAQRVPNGYVVIGVINRYTGVLLFGHGHKNHDNRTPAALIMGAGGNYVEFDSVNKTVAFPNDTLVLNNGTNHYIQLATSKGNNVVSYADFASSALAIYLDVITEQLAIVKYNDYIPDNYLLLCSFRTNSGGVSINAPYKWNGKPYKLDAEELDIEVPDIADYKTNFNVKSINHRGYNTEAPENTLSAFKLSARNGFDYVECDVSFTSDGVPVVLHDGSIDRTSNGTGNINSLTFDQVRSYDFGSWFSDEYKGEKIPSFEEFISLCRALSLHPYIEIKSSATYTQEQINQLISIVQRYGMTGKVTYISFNAKYLEYVKNTDANARLGYVVNDVSEAIITTALELKTNTNEVFVDAGAGRLTQELVYLCVNAGLPLEVWTVNSESSVRNLDPYVSGVTSDNVHAGKSLFKANL